MRPHRTLLACSLFAVVTSLAFSSSAQKKKGDTEVKGDEPAPPTATTPADAKADKDEKPDAKTEADKAADKDMKARNEKALDANDPTEDPSKTYYFVGLRYRHSILPKFMLNLFVAGGPKAVSIPSFGLEGGMRKDGFETLLSLTYADWGMDPFPFKGLDEDDTAYEIVKSDLKLYNVAVDLLWSTDFNKMFSFLYGATAGISIVTGDLYRAQAMPAGGDNKALAGDPYTYVPCPANAAGNGPAAKGAYCDASNDHYGDPANKSGYSDKSWFNGGKKPNLYAIFGPQIGFRFKPVKQFVARVDVGWNIFIGPFFGLGLQYGI
jgi:hypothetical protein